MSSRGSFLSFGVAALIALSAAGCAKHVGTPAVQDPAVFDDAYGEGVDFQAFLGSKVDAVSIDSTTVHDGATSLMITVPPTGDPSGTYAGGAFTHQRGRNLSQYNAITFWAKASRPLTFNVFGIGNDNTGTSRYTAQRSNVILNTTWKQVVMPLPLPSKLQDERGLFFFAEGPEAGQGATIWIDNLVFANVPGISNPRPFIQDAELTPDVGSYVTVPGTQLVIAVDEVDQVIDLMQNYFTFTSSADTVAVGGEGTVLVTGLGTATITAKLGNLPASGTLTLTPNPSPVAGAPVPSHLPADVISLFSDSYTNVAVDTWSASWDVADVADVSVQGNPAKKYSNLSYAGIEFLGAHVVNASTMTHFHIDVWAAAGTSFKVKLVDFGANGVYGGADDKEQELTFTSASNPAFNPGGWSSLDIPLSAFTNLTTRAHLAQLILAGDAGAVYVDNLYFHK